MSVTVYVACRMTGRDKKEQIARAKYVCGILKQYGICPISPVIEEGVEDRKGPLINTDRARLQYVWNADKDILRRRAHVMLWDGANDKSFGCERELGLMRYCLWKPVILLMPKTGLTVADIEDDAITDDVHVAGAFIRAKYGTRWKRFKWRAAMLIRTLPFWLWNQVLAWR